MARASARIAAYNIFVKYFRRLAATCFVLGAVFYIDAAHAAAISFDGAPGGLSLAGFQRAAAVEPPAAAPEPAGAHVYDFKSLYRSLGYPSPDYFGSTEAELQDLDSYTSKEDTFYSEINGYLRFYPAPYDWYGTGPDDAKIIVKHIDSIFGRAPALPKDLILFRGLGLGWHGDKPFAPGEEFVDKGYVSTSASYEVARHFAVGMSDGEEKASRRAVFVLYLARPGEKGILIDKENEDEVILPHGRRFKVMAAKNAAAPYDLYLVQVCAAACDAAVRPDVDYFWSGFSPPN